MDLDSGRLDPCRECQARLQDTRVVLKLVECDPECRCTRARHHRACKVLWVKVHLGQAFLLLAWYARILQTEPFLLSDVIATLQYVMIVVFCMSCVVFVLARTANGYSWSTWTWWPS